MIVSGKVIDFKEIDKTTACTIYLSECHIFTRLIRPHTKHVLRKTPLTIANLPFCFQVELHIISTIARFPLLKSKKSVSKLNYIEQMQNKKF